jgi:hypothetical protein
MDIYCELLSWRENKLFPKIHLKILTENTEYLCILTEIQKHLLTNPHLWGYKDE